MIMGSGRGRRFILLGVSRGDNLTRAELLELKGFGIV